MMFPLYSSHFTWPSLEARLQDWVENLAQRRSLLILLPTGVSAESLWALLAARLDSRSLDPDSLTLSSLMAAPISTNERLEQKLAQALNIQWSPVNCPRTAEHLVRQPDLPPVIGLLGFDVLASADQQQWLTFLKRWGAAAHSAANTGDLHCALCLFITMGGLDRSVTLPSASLYLDVVQWWGIPTALEVHLYCRSVAAVETDPTVAIWGEYLIPSLVGADVDIVESVWPLTLGEEGALLDFLAEEGRLRGWDTCDTAQAARDAFPAQPRSARQEFAALSNAAQQWWAQGMLYYTTEYGVELHTSVLALAGHHDTIRHRLWRGQASLLLPLLDQVRLALCSHFTERYGSTWPVRWDLPPTPEEEAAVRATPLATQWGYLAHLLNYASAFRAEKQYNPLVNRARQLRNRLAHYQPVSFTDFRRFWQDLEMQTWLNGGDGTGLHLK